MCCGVKMSASSDAMVREVSQVMSPSPRLNHCAGIPVRLDNLVFGMEASTRPYLDRPGNATALGMAQPGHRPTGGDGLPESMAGILVQDQGTLWESFPTNLTGPMVALIGGPGSDQQLVLLEQLVQKMDKVLVCGMVAHSFMEAGLGVKTGSDVATILVRRIQEKAKVRGCQIMLPIDWSQDGPLASHCSGVAADWTSDVSSCVGSDIGRRSIALFAEEIGRSKTLVWHGLTGMWDPGAPCASATELFEAMLRMRDAGGVAVVSGEATVAEVVRRGLAMLDRNCYNGGKFASSSLSEGVWCSVHSDNFAVQTLGEVDPEVDGQEESRSSKGLRRSCGEECRPNKEEYFLEPAFASPRGLEPQPSQTFPFSGSRDTSFNEEMDRPLPANRNLWGPPDDHEVEHVSLSTLQGNREAGARAGTKSPGLIGSSRRVSLVKGDTDGVGSDDSEGVSSHKTRGEVTDPTNPVFSVAIPQAQLPSTHVQPEHSDVIDDRSFGPCGNVVHEGPGVKACKHTIPKGTRALPSNDEGNEDAEISELAGRGKSDQQPVGFRPDLAESVVTSQPIGFRPDLAEPVVTSQPVGFRPDLAEPVVTSQPVGFRPDLSVSTVVSQHMGSRTEAEVPVPVSSYIGFRRLEPSFGEQGVGFPIHVELRESTSGESLREGCIVDAPQSHIVSDRGNAMDLSPGTLGERKPRLRPDQWQVVGHWKRSNEDVVGVVSHKDDDIRLLQRDCDHMSSFQEESHPWDSTGVLYGVVGSNILSATPTTEYSVRSYVGYEGSIIRSAAIRSLPSSGTGASLEGSKQELCGISEEGEGTTPSMRAVALPQSTVAHGPQIDQPFRGSVPLLGEMPTSASRDEMHGQPDRRRALLRPRFALPSWVEQATTKVSQDLWKVPSKGKAAEQDVCEARSLPGYVSRPDALPSWVHVELSAEQCPSSAQRPAQESCMPDKVAGMLGQPSGHPGAVREENNPAAMDQIPWSTWFSQAHVCGSQCFPPCTSKKVQPRMAGETYLESSSESSPFNDSDMEASSLDYADWPEPASGMWPGVMASYAAVSLHPPVAISPGIAQLPEPGVAPQMPRAQSLDACTKAGSCAAARAYAFNETKGVEDSGVSPDPDHKPLGFSPESPQVQGPICGSINLGPNHEPIGFSPDLPQVQGFPVSRRQP